MFGQQNPQQTTGGLFGAAPQLGQTTGGFSFGAGSSTTAASSAPASGFSFSAPTQPGQPSSTGFSFGATTSAATAIPGTTGGFSLGATPATQAGGFSFGAAPSRGFNFGTPVAAATVTSTTTPQTGGFTFGSGTSAGIAFGTPSTQQASSGLKLGTTGGSGFAFGSSAPSAAPATGGLTLGGTTTVAGSSPFVFGKTLAATGSTNTGFTLGGTTAQPATLLGLAQTPKSQSGGLTGSAPSQGFAFGVNKSTAPATVTPTPGLSFGGGTIPASTASTGLTLGNAGAATGSGFTLGAPQATTVARGLILGGGLQSAGTSTAAGTTATGIPVGFTAPVRSTATPLLSSLSGLASTTVAPIASTASTGLPLGLKLPVTSTTATTTVAGFSVPGTGGFKFGTTSAASLTTATTTTTTTAATTMASVVAGLGTTASTASTSSSSTTSAATSSVPQLTYKQLEELINKWAVELADYEKTFLDQATQVNAWDRLLMENGEKITELNANVENVKAEQKRLDQELDFIMAQQQELEEMLKPLEDAVRTGTSGSRQLQQADKERDVTYKLAKDIDGQLKQMVQDLKSIIDHLNTANSQQQDSDDPITQIAKILNAHMNSLQWIDQNSGILQRKVDEIARLSETRRKEQERNFRLAFD